MIKGYKPDLVFGLDIILGFIMGVNHIELVITATQTKEEKE